MKRRCNVIGDTNNVEVLYSLYDEVFTYSKKLMNIADVLYTFLVNGEDIVFVPPLSYDEIKLLFNMLYEASFPGISGKVYIISPDNRLEQLPYSIVWARNGQK